MKKIISKVVGSIVAAALFITIAYPAANAFSGDIILAKNGDVQKRTDNSSYILQPNLDLFCYGSVYWHSKFCHRKLETRTVNPTYYEEGYTVYSCGYCGYENKENFTPKLDFNPNNPQGAGRVFFKVVDAQTKEQINDATLVLQSDSGRSFEAHSSGINPNIVVPIGKYTATATRGNQVRSFSITVREGDQTLPLIGLSSKPLVEGRFTCKLMTLEEIKSAGIDITNPENQHIYNYRIVFDFVADDFYLGFYFNKNGEYVGFSPDNTKIPNDYIIVYPGDGSDGNGGNVGNAGGNKPPHIQIYNPSTGDNKCIYPVNEHFYIIVHGNAKWLKEMFDVEMLVINNSFTDTVEDCIASIKLPEGLSLAEMTADKEKQTLTQKIDLIDYGGTHSFHWYIKGDNEGEYNIEGNLSGVLKPFDEKFNYKYSLESPIHVYAGKALHMTVFAPVAAYHGQEYNFKIQFENVSDRPIYGFTSSITDASQYRRAFYSTKGKEIEFYGSDNENLPSYYTESFYPGDKIVMECSTDILFKSDIVKRQLEGAVKNIDELRTMIDSTSAYNSVVTYISDADGYFNSLMQKLNNLKSTEESEEKVKAYDSLLSATSKLYETFSSSDERAIDIIAKLKLSDFYDDLRRYATRAAALIETTPERINQVAAGFNWISDSELELNVQVLDEIKAAICALPMRFILENVSVITLSGSTTEIPYSVEMLPDTSENYVKIIHLTNRIKDIIVKYAGGLDAPKTARYFNGKVKADKQVKFTDSTTFMVVSSSGDTSYRVWIEKADSKKINKNFTLSCDAEDSKFNNGYLTFTSSGNIKVSAKKGSIGILKIEATAKDGTTQIDSYQIESVKKHQCAGERREIIIPSDLVSDGIKAILCDECDSIIGTEAYRDEYLGDVNNDRVVDIEDAVMIFSYDAGIEKLTTEEIERADTTDDGKISGEDAMLILMDDTSMSGNYSPSADITRAVFVAVLYRMEGQPECSQTCKFRDVSSDSWYRNAIIWASENGIVNGITEDTFDPDGEITREQMATLLNRYVKYRNVVIDGSDSFVAFNDMDKVSDYAKEAVSWISSTGLMIGTPEGAFSPVSMATKEQTAIVLVRMMKMLK